MANGLDSLTSTYALDSANGVFKPLEVVPAAPQEFTGDNTTAEFATSADDRFLYVFNRCTDSIAIFAIGKKNGLLKPDSWTSAGRASAIFRPSPTGNHL